MMEKLNYEVGAVSYTHRDVYKRQFLAWFYVIFVLAVAVGIPYFSVISLSLIHL